MNRKVILVVVLALAALVAVGAWSLLANLNGLVARAIEKHGSAATGTAVGVAGVDIELRQGTGGIDRLTVANPDGFGGGEAFTLGNITIVLDLAHVRHDPLVVDEVRVAAPAVRAVVNAQGGLNLDVLRKHLAAATAGDPGSDLRLRIMSFTCERGSVAVDAAAVGLGARTVDLPSISLHDIGGADGTTPDGVARAVLDAVAKQAAAAVAQSGLAETVKDKVGDALGDKAKDLLQGLGR